MTRYPQRKTVYRGYSTIGKRIRKRLYDVELVKQDLLNHFNTKKNERFRDANFGSLIPDLLFEHMTEDNLNKIRDEVIRIIETDDRVTLIDYTITTGDHSFTMECELYYIGLDRMDNFKLNFDTKNSIVTEDGDTE